MGVDNVGTATSILERIRSRLNRIRNKPRSPLRSTARPVYEHRTRSRSRQRKPSSIKQEMIVTILEQLGRKS